jgi:hypothetical protein
MKRTLLLCVFAGLLAVGCSLSPEEKAKREELIKSTVGTFIGSVISGSYGEVYKLSTGRFESAAALEQHLKQPWAAGPSLLLGKVASMTWVDDSTAKVKVVWTFQQGNQQSYSAETLVWVWKGGGWKYEGRSLR